MMTSQFLTGAPMLVQGAWLQAHGVLIENGRIAAILPETAQPHAVRQHLPAGTLLAPGLLDVQVNGGGGVLFNDNPTAQTAARIAKAHRALGTTAILPTLITDTPEKMRDAARIAVNPDQGVHGLHFEGPFLSPERPGIHRAAFIRQPDADDLACLRAIRHPVLVTLAPETVPDVFIQTLAASGIVVCAGHSAASYERTLDAINAGLRGFTHLFNAMPPLSARAPGLAGAALDTAETFAGVIADGLHVHPAMLRLLLAAKGCDKIFLVSDAMAVTGTRLAGFTLLGQPIARHQKRLVSQDGTLAGADICLADAVRTMAGLGVTPANALRMASEVPAAFLRLDHLIGRIAPGLRADLLLLTQDLHVRGTWLAGAWEPAS